MATFKQNWLLAAVPFTFALLTCVNAFPDYQWPIMGGTGFFALSLLAASYFPALKRWR